jgi:hypothetical protein
MRCNVVRVGMADEHQVCPSLRLVRIQPEPELGQMNTTSLELQTQKRHRLNLSSTARKFNLPLESLERAR